MTTYTADDFKNARFATRGPENATRDKYVSRDVSCWQDSEGDGFTDSEMARDGWSPVQGQEARGNALAADLAAAVVRADTAEADLADFQAMHARQIETIARLQKNPRPLTADDITDEMIRRARTAWLEFARTDGTPTPEVTREMLSAALTEPPARPEGAEAAEEYLRGFLGSVEFACDIDPAWLADHLIETLNDSGVRVTGGQS